MTPPDVNDQGQVQGRDLGWLRWLPALTLVAVLTITASAEFELARTVLHLPPQIAWALPVAVDSYVLAALRSGRDVLPALTVMAGALAASMGAHLADTTTDGPLPAHVVAPAATAIMTALVIVAWRVHVLIPHRRVHPETAAPDDAPATVTTSPGTPASHRPKVDTPDTSAPSTPRRAVASTPRVRALPRTAPAAGTAAQPGPTATGTGPTDSEILAALTANGWNPPSIRALMRTYGIGQSRASRLHQAARQATHEQQQQNGSRKPEGSQKNQPNASTSTNNQNELEKAIQESTANEQRNTHPGITDRVGQSRSTTDHDHADSSAPLQIVGQV
jgi:hypothetical protein